jgi:hypothetical protein
LISVTLPALPGGNELSGWLADILTRRLRLKRLDDDFLSQWGANSEAHVADLTDDIAVLAEQSNTLLLAKTHFAQAMSDFGRCAKLFDPAGSPHAHLAERTNERRLTTLVGFHQCRLFRLFDHGPSK